MVCTISFCHSGRPWSSVAGSSLRAREQLAVAFAQPHPFDGQQRVGALQRRVRLQRRGTCARDPTAMIISGTLTLRLKKRAR